MDVFSIFVVITINLLYFDLVTKRKSAPGGGAAQLASVVKMKFHEVSSSIPPDLQSVPRMGPRGHTWRL